MNILGMAPVGPIINKVYDVGSKTNNEIVTPGQNLKVSGDKIRIVGENSNVGVYFIDSSDSRTKIEADMLAVNIPSELVFVIPTLAQGSYSIELITQQSGNSQTVLKDPRTTRFEHILEVI